MIDDLCGAVIAPEGENIYTVFPKEPDEPWQDFESLTEAREFGDKEYGPGNYTIESPTECDAWQ